MSRTRFPRYHRVILLIILLMGAWLRFDALTQDVRFHVDEAFFATFARNAAVQGDWMLSGALDKSPLSLYASALSMHFTGVTVNEHNVLDLVLKTGEFSARLPAVLAGIVSIALVYIIGRRIGSVWVGLYSAGIIAFSPLMVGYSATAFTDTLMLAFLLASLASALNRRALFSGALLALAFATKQQALFYLPLIVGVLWLSGVRGRGWSCFARAFVLGLMLLILWDSARPETSIFTLASVNNNPERFFVSADELLPRLRVWLDVLAVGFGHGVLLLVGVALAVYGVVNIKSHEFRRERRIGRSAVAHTGATLHFFNDSHGLAFALYIALYLIAHWLIAFNTYDRYLLPIMPLLAVLVGVGVTGVLFKIEWHRYKKKQEFPFNLTPTRFARFPLSIVERGGRTIGSEGMRSFIFHISHSSIIHILTLFTLCLLLIALQQPFPEDNRRRDDAFIELMDYVNAKPLGTIVYDHWMGWQSGYYRGAWSDKRFVYYPDPFAFADDAPKNPEQAPRYFIAPADVDIVLWLTAFNAGGFDAQDITDALESDDFLIYELILR